MYDDIILSQSQMAEYHERQNPITGSYAFYKMMFPYHIIDVKGLDVKVLGKSAWPTILYNKAPNNFIIPKELEVAVKSYGQYYE